MTEPRDALRPHDDPGIATAEGGVVLLDGPDGIAITLTPDCAARTGQSLLEAAAIAEREASATSSAER